MEGDIFLEVEMQAQRLGLPQDFYGRLRTEDDWSFVIKLNALVEAACCDALAARLHAPELAASFATLDIGHPKHGKVALLVKLGAIEKEQAVVLQTLYELRNNLAHNINQVAFTFENHLARLDKQQRANFVQRAGYGLNPTFAGIKKELFVEQNPKFALWITVAEILACLHLEHDVAASRLVRLAVQKLGAPLIEDSGPEHQS